MNDDASDPVELASLSTTPPTTSSYWVVPGRLLAGADPGDSDPEAHRAKVQALIDAGIRTFVNLMEKDETNYAGEPFAPYQHLARQLCPDASCCRHAIRDLSAPTPERLPYSPTVEHATSIGPARWQSWKVSPALAALMFIRWLHHLTCPRRSGT